MTERERASREREKRKKKVKMRKILSNTSSRDVHEICELVFGWIPYPHPMKLTFNFILKEVIYFP